MLKKTIYFTLLLVCLASAAFFYWATQPIADRTYEFTIKSGSTFLGVSDQMVRSRLPISPFLFQLLARITQQAHHVQAGTFEVKAGTTPYALLKKMVRGEFAQFRFTIIEGWTFVQLREAIAKNPYFLHDTAHLSDQAILEHLTEAYTEPEGLFFPDTYWVPKKASDWVIYQHAFNQLEKQLQLAWQKRESDHVLKTPYEALILASLIEKETGAVCDRGMIAGVFQNRLQKGMRLQTDPAVIYGLGERYLGRLRKKDLLEDTPYNTYLRKGLPPTPIALVGMASLTAALHPVKTNALYFVARGDGSSHFSTNLNDHNKAVRYYLK